MSEVYAAQKKYAEKQKEQGMIKVAIWVPEEYRERALESAEKLRKEYLKN